MLVPPRVFPDSDELGDAVAALVVDRLGPRPAGRDFLLGCPGGRSARSAYAHLARRAAAERLDLSRLVVVMMDEYVVVGPDGRFAVVDPGELHSCRRFANDEIVGPINSALAAAGLPEAYAVPQQHVWLPDPSDPEAYERRIADAGGIDLFLLASGAGDGHVAFNSPGAPAHSRTRVVELPETTRRDNLATFPSFGGDLDAVPSHGVTVGVATIRESAEVVMVVHGADKRLAAERLSAARHYEADWPATVLADCRSPHLFLDRAAWVGGTLGAAADPARPDPSPAEVPAAG